VRRRVCSSRSQSDASSWRAEEPLDDYLKAWNIPGVDHIDTAPSFVTFATRSDARCLSSVDTDADSVIEKARKSPAMENRELAAL